MPYSAPTPPRDASDDAFEPWELTTAQAVVAAFTATHGRFHWHDHEDLVQECLSHWWEQRHRYDANRGANLKTFMKRVLRNRLRDLRREERAEKRGAGRPTRSLDEPVQSDDGAGSTIANLLRDGSPEANPEALALDSELHTEILRAKHRLTPLQQALVNGLFVEQTVSELSESLDVPRSSLYDEMKRIRAEFESEGLRKLLD